MKNSNPLQLAKGLLGVFIAIMLMTSCKKYSETIFASPEISIEGSNYLEIKRGEQIAVTLNLRAEDGNKELIVFQNGALLDRVPLPADAATYTYTGQSVPADAGEGEEFTYQLWLVNTENYPSERVTLTVSTIAYETITIGETPLYAVEIPEDKIIGAGTTYRFVSGRNYYINNSMLFQPGASLEVQAGVHLYMDPDAAPEIEITDGASVEMIGTAEAPIIITSANTLTSAGGQPGDWGTLNLRMTDGSGEVNYVRLEYGGTRTLRGQGVNAPTVIEHVQVYKPGAGEGIMVTNGNVNLKYIVATDCQGSSFRLGDAYAGQLQFIIATSNVQSGEVDEFSVRETASPTISNITVLGPGTNVSNTHGIRLRANSSAKIYNSIIAEFPRRGLRLNDNVQVTDLNGQTVFAHSFIFNVPTDPYRDDTDQGNPFRGYVDGSGNLQNPFFNNIEGFSGNNPILTVIPGIGVHDFVPDAEQTSAFNATSLGSFFSSAAFVGAVRNAENDWTRGWVKNSDGTVR